MKVIAVNARIVEKDRRRHEDELVGKEITAISKCFLPIGQSRNCMIMNNLEKRAEKILKILRFHISEIETLREKAKKPGNLAAREQLADEIVQMEEAFLIGERS